MAWSDAYNSSGFSANSTDILKIGNDGISKTNGKGVTAIELDYIKVEKGDKPSSLNLVGSLFRDTYYNKVSNLTSGLAFNDLILSLFLENATTSTQNVLVKINVSRDGTILDDYSFNEYVVMNAGELKDIDLRINLPEDKTGLQIKAEVYYGESYSEVLANNIELK